MKILFFMGCLFLFYPFAAKVIFHLFFRLCSIVSRETICIKFENNLNAMSDYRMNVCDARFVTFAKRSG